jgi:hypothetical protein
MKTPQTPPYRRFVIVLWMAFVLKGLFYCVLFPIWEGFDEYAHMAFVEFVVAHHDLPVPQTLVSKEIDQSLKLVPLPWLLRDWPAPHVPHDQYWQLPPQERATREQELLRLPPSLQSESGDSPLYEGQQGPLYYWLMAPLDWAVHNATLPTRVLILRVVNVLLASLIIPILFLCGQRFFRDERAAIVSCAFLAAMPEFYIDTARVGNQTLATVLYGILTLLCLAALDGKPKYLSIGTVLGLLLLTKAYSLSAIPAICFVLIWTFVRSKYRKRSPYLPAAALACAGLVAGWWFLRNFQLMGTLVWISSAPKRPTSISDLMYNVSRIDWVSALKSFAASHLWFGNWSFLTVRSWMYEVLEGLLLLLLAGVIVITVRSLSGRSGRVSLQNIVALSLMFGSFIAALAYHVLITFINAGIAATCGWYLYAVAVPEALLAVSGLTAFGKWGRPLFLAVAGLFAALELYATHWVLIPYYTGWTVHTSSGALQSFHPERAGIGVTEILTRLHADWPVFITNGIVFFLWLLYLIGTVGVFYIAVRGSLSFSEPVTSPDLRAH